MSVYTKLLLITLLTVFVSACGGSSDENANRQHSTVAESMPSNKDDDDSLIIHSFAGIGSGYLGMDIDAFAKSFGEPLKRSQTNLVSSLEYSDECFRVNADKVSRRIVSFIFYSKCSKQFQGATDRGVQLGMSKREVIKKYGEDYEDSTNPLLKDSDYASITYRQGKAAMEFQFTSEIGLCGIIIEDTTWPAK